MYKDKELFGKIKYFFVHEFWKERYMLAYIQWTSDVHIDRYGIKRFREFGKHDFIKVDYIDRCVGIMRIGDIFYISNKENQAAYIE